MENVRTKTVLLAVLAAALALVGAGCGGGKSETTTTAASATAWADGVCSAVGTWKTDMQEIANGVKAGSVTKKALSDAATKARQATDELGTTLKGLGAPDTSSGAQAKQAVDRLATSLSASAKTIQDTISSASDAAGVLTAVSTVSTTLVSMGQDVSSTVTDLQKLDVKGELGRAFESSDACAALRQ